MRLTTPFVKKLHKYILAHKKNIAEKVAKVLDES